MKITIDTQTDTYDDIKKVLHILTNILEQKGLSGNNGLGNNFENSGETNGANLMSMFDAPTNPAGEKPNTPPNFGSFINLVDNGKRENRNLPGIQVY